MIIQNCRVVTSECNDVVLESIFLPRDGKIMLNLNQHAIFLEPFTCVCVSLCTTVVSYTIQHRTVLIILPPNVLQTSIQASLVNY